MSNTMTSAATLQDELQACTALMTDFRLNEATGRLLDALLAAAQAGVSLDARHQAALQTMQDFARDCWPTSLWPAPAAT